MAPATTRSTMIGIIVGSLLFFLGSLLIFPCEELSLDLPVGSQSMSIPFLGVAGMQVLLSGTLPALSSVGD